MANLVGIDVGLVLHRATSGLCRTGSDGFSVARSYTDQLSRQSAIEIPEQIDLLAIDGPVLPTNQIDYRIRPTEKALLWNVFRRRCAVGETCRGIGAALRRGGCDTARQFGDRTANSNCQTTYPQIQAHRHVIEAFPNAFMGVMLDDAPYMESMPRLKRGGRFEWLLSTWRKNAAVQQLKTRLQWDEPELWKELASNGDHEEQAALVCALTAVCVYRNAYVAVGEPIGGYLFLPPWELWAEWAIKGIDHNRN